MTAAQMPEPIELEEYADIMREIEEQPRWRHIADREMDYADGNQLDSELLKRQAQLGIPPAIEDMISPTLLSIQGYEVNSRTDWRVVPDAQDKNEDLADAISQKLNEAEEASGADRACSAAFRSLIGCGIGWLEVSRNSDPFRYPYRVLPVHRNEIHWDMQAVEPDLSDARWLRRMRWMRAERAALAFPEHAELIQAIGKAGGEWWSEAGQGLDGGDSTGLSNAWNDGRAWTLAEDRYFNPTNKNVAITELWYRRWVRVTVIVSPSGRAAEYDEHNPAHTMAVASGVGKVSVAVIAKTRRAYYIGPHKLHDGETPYSHRHFPYVPFWGFKEDTTGVPYGLVRGMKYAQDSLNSGAAKLRWGMSVTRVERTKGAVAMNDAQLRRQIARPDADIVLDAAHMAQQGARFEVKRDYQLTDQHFQMLQDNRESIERVSGITQGFKGQRGTATSGVQEQTQVEQSNQSVAWLMDNFRAGRKLVGELLMRMIIADIGSKPETVPIRGDAARADRRIPINIQAVDPATGQKFLDNDVQRARLKVALEEVPSSASFRSQQLYALTEAIKPLPPQYLAAAIPFLTTLMDVPFRKELVEAFRKVQEQPSPEAMEQQIQMRVQQALKDSQHDLKEREVALKEQRAGSEVRNLDAKAVQIGVQAAFSAMQAGAQIAQMPMIAPIADKVMQGAGYQAPSPAGVDPDFPAPDQIAARNVRSPYIEGEGAQLGSEQLPVMPSVRENTSPAFPPVPDEGGAPAAPTPTVPVQASGGQGHRGIETPTVTDNQPVPA